MSRGRDHIDPFEAAWRRANPEQYGDEAGDGHAHDATTDGGGAPGLALPQDDVQLDALAGFVVGALLPVLRAEMASTLEQIAVDVEKMRRHAETAQHPPLVSLAYLAWYSDSSEMTARRWTEKLGIPKRNMSGHLWKDGDGPVRYAMREWVEAKAKGTHAVTGDVDRHEARLRKLLDKQRRHDAKKAKAKK